MLKFMPLGPLGVVVALVAGASSPPSFFLLLLLLLPVTCDILAAKAAGQARGLSVLGFGSECGAAELVQL